MTCAQKGAGGTRPPQLEDVSGEKIPQKLNIKNTLKIALHAVYIFTTLYFLYKNTLVYSQISL